MKSKTHARSPRLVYLVRCWPVETENGPVWRATVEDPHNAERRNFADLDALFAFLERETEAIISTK
jgi:hypothetical protein